MPLAIQWPAHVKGGRALEDFVSHTDLAPTILEAAGLKSPPELTGRSLFPLLTSEKSGQVDPMRDKVFLGRERHASVRASNVGYPIRAIRTKDFLYLRNFEPDRWPAGDPPIYGDMDQHLDIAGSPSKQAVVEHGGKPDVKRLFELSFGKRPAGGTLRFEHRPVADEQRRGCRPLCRYAESPACGVGSLSDRDE
jgi:hypothetical protein